VHSFAVVVDQSGGGECEGAEEYVAVERLGFVDSGEADGSSLESALLHLVQKRKMSPRLKRFLQTPKSHIDN
jgi:hypothetical protein